MSPLGEELGRVEVSAWLGNVSDLPRWKMGNLTDAIINWTRFSCVRSML